MDIDDKIISTADEMFFKADKKIKENAIIESLEILNDLVKKYPNYGRAYNHIGWIYETQFRDYAKAEENYKKAIGLSPEYPATYLNYAIVLSTLERFEDLEQLLSKALKVPGINKDKIYNEYGIMYEFKGEFDEAIKYYKLAIRYSLNDKDIEIFNNSIKRITNKKGIFSNENNWGGNWNS